MTVRITESDVRKMAEFANKISKGKVKAADHFPSNERGVVYTDGHRQLSWNGKNASSRAFAYYFGGCLPFLNPGNNAEWQEFNDIYAAIENRPGVNEWFHNGNHDALSRRGYKRESSDNS